MNIKKIYKSLLLDIQNQKYLPGDLLPTENELAEQFNTTRMNAHRAVKELERNNLVLRTKRLGTAIAEDVDYAQVAYLIKDTNQIVYVLKSSSPMRMHWDNSTFRELEDELSPSNFSVEYLALPTGENRDDYISMLKRISNAGASALVIFPGSKETIFFQENADLLFRFQMPVYMLNRGSGTFPLEMDMVSFITIDHFGDGATIGRLLAQKKITCAVMLNDEAPDSFWGKKRYEGVCMGLRTEPGGNEIQMENIPATHDGLEQTIEKIKNTPNLAVIAVNNIYAVRLINRAQKFNLKVPNDFQLISFDYDPAFADYHLTTLALPIAKIGKLFGRLINTRIFSDEFRGKFSIKINSELRPGKTFR